jgi:hypothetical protein
LPLTVSSSSARARHIGLALSVAPSLLISRQQRRLFQEMRRFMGTLPAAMQKPLPAAMTQLTPNPGTAGQPNSLPAETVCRLADLVALLDRRSPLGLCLRRSLLRYHFLRQSGVPLVVCFGARLAAGEQARKVAGHAWTILDERPYHEDDENWRNFAVMFRWPAGVDDRTTN